MGRYWLIVGSLMTFLLLCFFAVEALQITWLTDPSSLFDNKQLIVASLGIALLVGDVLLPVPSSLVMVGHGAVFGVWLGTLLSMLGSVGGGLVGLAIGRRSGKLLERLVSEDERTRANQLLAQWGWLAIICSRPVPILAETVIIMAGASTLSRREILPALVVGTFPAAFLYALTGATAARWDSFLTIFGLLLITAGIFWLVGSFIRQKGFMKEPIS